MRVWKANLWLSFIYLEADNNPCSNGGLYSESTPQIIKVQAQRYLYDIIGVRFTNQNCDPEYEGILLEYRYLLLLHAFQQPALTHILHEPLQGA